MNIITSDKHHINPILNIHRQAFGETAGPVIAGLVADLFQDESARPGLSLVATDKNPDQAPAQGDAGILGHILFTRARIMGTRLPVSAMLLAPLAVSPEVQGRGIGQALIRDGLDRLRASGVDLVFVLGHPGYYPKAGFTPAGVRGFSAPYPIPEKDAGAWMVRDLGTGLLGWIKGTVQCARALDRPEHWRE